MYAYGIERITIESVFGVHRSRGNLCHVVVLILIILVPLHIVAIDERLDALF